MEVCSNTDIQSLNTMKKKIKKLLTTCPTGRQAHYLPDRQAGLLRISKGFTLIELTVLMGITIMISGIIFLNFRQGEKNLAIQRAAHRVTQAISEAVSNSLAGKLHGDSVSPGGFGLFLEQNSQDIIIFADCNSNQSFDASGGSASCEGATVATPYGEKVSTVTLEKDITVSTLNPCSGTPCQLVITFLPPDPRTLFEPSLAGNEAQVTLRDSEDRVIHIFVNKLGIARVQQ